MQLLIDQLTCKMHTLSWNFFEYWTFIHSALFGFFSSSLNKFERNIYVCVNPRNAVAQPIALSCSACHAVALHADSELLQSLHIGFAMNFWAIKHVRADGRAHCSVSMHIWTLLSVLPTLMQYDYFVHKIMA